MALIHEAFHIVRYAFFRKQETYGHSNKEICECIVSRCWNEDKGFFQTSLHNYPLFYARDFGMCVDALLKLGYREKVRKTLSFALRAHQEKGCVTQQVSASGKAFSFPNREQPDALAFLLYSLHALNNKSLLKKYESFLEKDLARFVKKVVEQKGEHVGLVKKNLRVAGMRDYAVRKSSCYDNAMLGAISKYCDKLKLKNPLKKYDYKKLLVKHFWTGEHFTDDLYNKELTGDANVAPFWFGVVDKKYFAKANKNIKLLGLHLPFALRYEPHRNTSTKMRWLDVLAGGWECDTVWLHLGNLYIDVLKKYDKKQYALEVKKQAALVEKLGHYPEVLHPNGDPFKGLFFRADDAMLWAVNLLAHTKI